MEVKRNKLINAILFVILILTILAILYLTKSDVLKKEEVVAVPEEVIPNSGFEVYEVEGLEKKINKLSFTNKKQDFYNKSSKVNINTHITSGHVSVVIKIDKVKRTYEVEGISDAISIHTNFYKDNHVTYILTKDGKVYKVEDDINVVKSTEDYKGVATDLGLVDATKIAIDKNLKFKIDSNHDEVVPCVYVKTSDNRIFTNEKIIDGKDIVELKEKIIENENTSESN